MPSASLSFSVEGTQYEYWFGDSGPGLDPYGLYYSDVGGDVMVPVSSRRSGSTAILDDVRISLEQAGEVIAEVGSGVPRGFVDTEKFLTGDITRVGEVTPLTIRVASEVWDVDEAVFLDVPTPPAPTSGNLPYTCSVSNEEIRPGDSTIVSVTVTNESTVNRDVRVGVALAQTPTSKQLTVAGDTSRTVEFEYRLDSPGVYDPVVSLYR